MMVQFLEHNIILALYRPYGQIEAALRFTERQLEKARQLDDDFLLALNAFQQSRLSYDLGLYERSIELVMGSLERFESAVGIAAKASMLGGIAVNHYRLGNLEAGRKYMQESVVLAEQGEDPMRWSYKVWCEIALASGSSEDLEAALGWAERFLEWMGESSAVDDLSEMETKKAQILLALYQLDPDPAQLESALEASTRAVHLGDTELEAFLKEEIYYTHFLTLRELGREEEAETYLKKAFDWVQLVARQTETKAWRLAWLEVPRNREILTEAAARGWVEENL